MAVDRIAYGNSEDEPMKYLTSYCGDLERGLGMLPIASVERRVREILGESYIP